jgi:hypothetical protein
MTNKFFLFNFLGKIALLFALCFASTGAAAQDKPVLNYYLPAISYNPAIPTPAAFLGYEVGEWHVSHDQLLAYMRELDRLSDRITLREYGRSHENRPLINLTITHPDNFPRLEEIKKQRAQLADPARSAALDPDKVPAVAYMGYSIHGNEASGTNASLMVAYYLAAAQTPEVENLLRNSVLLLDPCFNPDGMQRFSSWVNSRHSKNLSPDPAGDEFNEPWPRGRFNHYWFDLNRDWLVAEQPESGGRVDIFQEWKPNVLTDHHEMGSNSTFFFQPGVPSRVNPITPAKNQELTAKIATYHAAILSDKKIPFYTAENFDDFYYGKGSTYPDANGCVGILFEQASSRGSAQETENGLLTFPYTIRNQVLTSLSTLRALGEMRAELNSYLREFYNTARPEAAKDAVKGYLWESEGNNVPANAFMKLLKRHNIMVYEMTADQNVEGLNFKKGSAFYVPCDQLQYRLIRGIFERTRTFQDSIFYDISAWTLPDAFGLQWTPVTKPQGQWTQKAATTVPAPLHPAVDATKAVAFVIEGHWYQLPQVIAALHREKVRMKLALKPFTADGKTFEAGALLIPMDNQPYNGAAMMRRLAQADWPPFFSVNNGLTENGPDLGSNNFAVLQAPKIVMLTGDGVNPLDAGEIWHLLDTRYGQALTLLEAERFAAVPAWKYNVLIMPDGSYGALSIEKIKEFVAAGGTIVATGNAMRWLKNSGIVALEFKSANPADGPRRRPYGQVGEDRGALSMPGAIFEAELDLSHPLCFGYRRNRLPLFMNDAVFLEIAKNPYATPALFGKDPLLAGYVHNRQLPQVANSAALVVGAAGRGRAICFAANPNFRAFWYGTNRLFANAIFFGDLISSETLERK